MTPTDVELVIHTENTPAHSEQAPVAYLKKTQATLAWLDFMDGLKKWRIWLLLAYQDIKLRYRRSVLGPFWLTLSMAITVYSMGYLYAHLFHVQLDSYYPFLVAGMLGWSLLSTVVMEYTDGFVTSESLIKQVRLPYSLHMHRIIARNLLIFFHNIFVIVPILIIFHKTVQVNFCLLLLIPGLLVIYVNAISYGLILSIIGARYRDISQIIKSLIQVVFFITPVMWGAESVTSHNRYRFIVDLNPFYSFLELIRQPLLGHTPTMRNLIAVLVTTLLGIVISAIMLTRYRSRIVYWL